jgi:hypothetical protein
VSATDKRERPRALRRLMIFRPPGLDMRALNPCVLARFLRLGWYVLFIITCKEFRKIRAHLGEAQNKV